jgi:hypothetical protein
MSGGHFDYNQFRIRDISDAVQDLIDSNHEADIFGYCREFRPEIISAFRDGYKKLCFAEVYAQRIDWLVSGDDDEESFLQRLKEDIDELNKELDES